MSPIPAETLLEQLQWRYATKKFDPSRKIAPSDWSRLEKALVLTPSSYGLQPWKFVVVEDPALREQLLPHSWNQRQVVDASHHVVFAIQKNMGVANIDALIQRTAAVRGIDPASIEGYRKMMIGDLVNGPRAKEIDEWATRQAYIALGNFMTSCAMIGVDTCPMEGIAPAQYDTILGLPEMGYRTVVACAAGYRAADDKYASLAKVRFDDDAMILRMGKRR